MAKDDRLMTRERVENNEDLFAERLGETLCSSRVRDNHRGPQRGGERRLYEAHERERGESEL